MQPPQRQLRAPRTRREQPIGLHAPDPIADRADGIGPEHEALPVDSVGLALLVVLETLSPPERLAFVLHDSFAVPFGEIAPLVERSPEAARQLASRAHRRVQVSIRFPTPTSTPKPDVVDAFLAMPHCPTAPATKCTCCPRTNVGSSVERTARLHPLWQALCR